MFDAVQTIEAPDAEPADWPSERVEHEIEQLAARLNADTCRWLELVAVYDRRQAWAAWGCLSCAHWLAWRCSLSLRSAREHVRVARSLAGVPAIHAEFALARLSYSKVRALTRVATPENEEELIELAGHATAAQLDVLVRAYDRASAAQAGDTHRNRYLSWFWEQDGSLSIHANLPAEDGATVLAALEAAAERIRDDRRKDDHGTNGNDAHSADRDQAELPHTGDTGGSAEPPEGLSVARAEAFVAMASDSMAAGGTGTKPAEQNLVVVHVDAGVLDAGGEGRCHLREGSGLEAETARRLACDASVVTLLELGGEPLSVGRRTRSIPPPMRRAVEARDGGCRFPGCQNRRYVDAHHIRHWASGGETSADNLVMLCRRHHRLVHEGGFSIERSIGDGSLTFRRPDGVALAPAFAPRPDSAVARADASRAQTAPESGPLRIGSGEPMDLDYAVLAMFQICEPRGRPRAAPV